MANLGPQHINLSYSGLLQVPNGVTSVLQSVTDGNGISSGLQISTTGIGGQITSSAVLITGGYIDSTPIGSNVPSTGAFSTLRVTGTTTLSTALTGILKASSGVVSNATAGTDYVSPSVLAQPNGVATLDSSGYLTTAQIPPIAIVQYLGTVNSQAAMLALTGQQGDWCIRSDLGTTWVITGSNPSVITSWTQLSYPTAPVTSVNGLTGAVSLSYGNVGAAPATTGSSILYANGSGGFSNVTVGTGLTFVSGTLAASSSGTVTSVSVATANGFAGTSSGGSTPALTLSTTVTGLLKGNGTAISAAVSGTDYAPATTGTSILKGNGSGGFSNAVSNTDYQSVITTTGILKGAGAGSIIAAVVGTDYAPATTGSSILKGNSLGGFANAVSGTDYAPATSGTSILYGSGSGGFSNVTIGSGLTFSTGTLSATSGGGGTVTNVSVVTANGFAGTVANPSTLPAITLSTSVTGLLKGNGTAVSAAVSGTDYAPATTGTSILKGNGAGGFSGAISGTDYAPATSGNSILYGNGAGGFSNVSIGSNMTFSSGVLNANATTSIVGSPGYYGSFYDTNATQVAANTTTAYPIKINSTFEANGVSIANDGSGNPTRVTFAKAGVYNFQYSIQFTNTDSSVHNVNVWLRKNDSGVTGDVPDSNSQYAVVGSHGGIAGQLIAAVNFVFTAAANDFFEIMWQPESTQVYIETIPASTTPTTPVAPGIIVTACQQAQIGVGYYGLTSSTSTLIGTGSKTFTTNFDSTAIAFTVGTRVRLAYSVTPANFMEGVITAFSGTTLVVNVDNTGGSGTYASWTVSVAGSFSATSGTSILYGNGSGGFSNVTVGSGLTFAAGTLSTSGGGTTVTISNDTATSSNLYPLFANATSGTVSTIYTGNANLLYKPSTGELQAQELIAANGLIVNSATIAASYSIPSGSNAMSAGPVTVASGQTVTVPSGSTWVVV
jgi:hypothetical protein